MLILHNMPSSEWQSVQHCQSFGADKLLTDNFLHCSPLNFWHRVAVRFDNDNTDMVLLLIDTELLDSPLVWEDGSGGQGRLYPHVYGVINTSAVVEVLPYLRNSDGSWRKNVELQYVQDE